MEQMQRNNVGHKNKINMFRCFLRTNTELYVFDNISLTKMLGIMEQRERTDAGIRTVFSLKLSLSLSVRIDWIKRRCAKLKEIFV